MDKIFINVGRGKDSKTLNVFLKGGK